MESATAPQDFGCLSTHCQAADDADRLLKEEVTPSDGLAARLRCRVCNAQLVPCDNCSHLVAVVPDEQPCEELYRTAPCSHCGAATVLDDDVRACVGLQPNSVLMPEAVVRLQVWAATKEVYRASKALHLQRLRALLHSTSEGGTSLPAAALGLPGSDSEEGPPSKRARQAADGRSPPFPCSPGMGARETRPVPLDRDTGRRPETPCVRACGEALGRKEILTAMARCRWQLLLVEELFPDAGIRHRPTGRKASDPPLTLLHLNLLRELHGKAIQAGCVAQVMPQETAYEGLEVIKLAESFLQSQPGLEAKRAAALERWKLVRQAEEDCARHPNPEGPGGPPAPSKMILLGVLRERQKLSDADSAKAAKWLLVNRDAVKRQQDCLCKALLGLASSAPGPIVNTASAIPPCCPTAAAASEPATDRRGEPAPAEIVPADERQRVGEIDRLLAQLSSAGSRRDSFVMAQCAGVGHDCAPHCLETRALLLSTLSLWRQLYKVLSCGCSAAADGL